MKCSGFHKQTGASVVEMLIIVAVIGVLVTIAVSQFGGSAANLDRQNIAREFKVNLERARFDSVKRRASACANMARVEITSDTSFSVYTDMNQDGAINAASEFKTVSFGNRSTVKIVGSTLPVTIRFDQRGNVTTGTCASPATTIPSTTFCTTPCATATAANSSVVFVSPTGTAAMLAGGSTMPTFAPPAVSNVNSNANVNPLLAVWDVVPVGSVTPTPVPTATPVPTPTPSPTATPNPSITPTPTPAPVACTYGQRPASTGCTCYSPMRVRSSGKCQ